MIYLEQELDNAAKANIENKIYLQRYYKFKQELKLHGYEWDEIELMLIGYIWDASEESYSGCD